MRWAIPLSFYPDLAFSRRSQTPDRWRFFVAVYITRKSLVSRLKELQGAIRNLGLLRYFP
jgi:hypothetical protein